MRARIAATIALFTVALAGCRVIPGAETPPVPSRPPPVISQPTEPAQPSNAFSAGLRAGPPIASLGLRSADAASALASFRESCPKLLSRTDASGLTTGGQWEPACTAARGWSGGDAAAFFDR